MIDGGTGGRIRARYGIKAPMGGRLVRRRITPTVGLWVLRRAWYPVSGSAVKIVLSISTGCRKDRELVWLCQSMDFTCRKFMPTKTLGYSQEEDFDIPEQYQNPCKMATEEERKQTPADVGGIDKMFE